MIAKTLKQTDLDTLDVTATGRERIAMLESRIQSATAGEALGMLDTYESLHCLVYGTLPDRRMKARIIANALDSRIKGDHNVDIYVLFRRISKELSHHNCSGELGESIRWHTTTLSSWYEEFRSGRYRDPVSPERFCASRQTLPLYDRLNRVAILLEEDLWAYETANQTAFKRRLATSHRPLAASLIGQTIDADEERALLAYISASRPYLS